MIVGIGIDTVEIDRFAHWHTYAPTTLQRIFSTDEINYCLSSSSKKAERFAVRFAAREAFFKALCMMNPQLHIPFLTVCKQVAVEKNNNGHPTLNSNWKNLINDVQTIKSFVSLTHTKTVATALVILETNL